jgi:hypothetical protein
VEEFGRGVGDVLSGSKQNDVAKTTAAATTEDAVRATHSPPILPIDVDNNKVGVIITVVGGDVTTTTTRTNVTRQKGEEDHDVISPKSV